jgi:hypothetical protein
MENRGETPSLVQLSSRLAGAPERRFCRAGGVRAASFEVDAPKS